MTSAVRASLYALAAVAFAVPLPAQGWIIPRPCGGVIRPMDERIPTPIMDCRPNISRTRSDVRVELSDRVLKYEVEERFINRGAGVGEADYLFPLPANAAFQDLKLSINGELVSGETMNAGDARRIYENIVRSQRDPALVEWMGHGLLRARIFPLNPGEEKRVVVRFQSVAPREGDALRVDYFRGAGQQGAQAMRDEGTSSFVLSYRQTSELGTPFSPTHSLEFNTRDGRREATVRGDARDVTLLVPLRRDAAASISMLPFAPGNEDAFTLVTVTPPLVNRGETTPRDITLVLDVSGSMQGRKMEQARAAGRQLLGTLRPDDRFRLIDFSSDVRTFKDDFVRATSDNLRDANRYLDALEAVGGTNIEGALREAMRPSVSDGRLPLILFITDGEPTVGERNADQLAALANDRGSRGSHRRMFTFGLGSDVNVGLLEQLSLEGRGTAQFVRPDESVERMVGVVANRLVDPVMTDVRVRVEGDVKLSKILPAQPSDIFADRDLVLLARYSGSGRGRIIVEGTRRGAPVQFTTNVEFPDRDRQNAFVARLWAAQRVGFLSADKRRTGGGREVDEEIRMLGERYGIPTEFTSYLVQEPRFAMIDRRAVGGGSAPPNAPAAAAADARGLQFESAKAASAQRAANSVAAVDSITYAAAARRRDVASAVPASERAASTRVVNGHTFVLRDGVWTDARYTASMSTTKIKPFSKAYFDIVSQLPDLRSALALGDRVIVVGRDRAISFADDGASELSASALAALVKAW